MHQDNSLRPENEDDQPSITVKISFPDFIFEVVIQLGEDGVEVGSSGFHFTYMKLIVSKRLIGLELKCKIEMDSKKPDKQLSTFTGEVSVSFVLFLYHGESQQVLEASYKIFKFNNKVSLVWVFL